MNDETKTAFKTLRLKQLLRACEKAIINGFRENQSQGSREHAEWVLGKIAEEAQLGTEEARLQRNQDSLGEVFFSSK